MKNTLEKIEKERQKSKPADKSSKGIESQSEESDPWK
jgi:hypothetical protein